MNEQYKQYKNNAQKLPTVVKGGSWQEPKRKNIVHQRLNKALQLPESGNSFSVLANKRREDDKEKKKEEMEKKKKGNAVKKKKKVDAKPKQLPGRTSVSTAKAVGKEENDVKTKSSSASDSSILRTKKCGEMSYFIGNEDAVGIRGFVDDLDRIVDLMLFPFGMTIGVVAGVPVKAVVYDALLTCIAEFVGSNYNTFGESKRIQGDEKHTQFFGSDECVGGSSCSIPITFNLFKELLKQLLENVRETDSFWKNKTLPLLRDLKSSQFRCVRYNTSNRIASAFANLLTEQLQLLSHAFVKEACVVHGVEVCGKEIEKETGVQGFRAEQNEEEMKDQGAPEELKQEKEKLQEEEKKVLCRMASHVRQQFVDSGCVQGNEKGGASSDEIRKFFNFSRSDDQRYIQTLRCIKLVEGLWRKMVAPFYKGVLPIPRKRKRWMFLPDNGSCKAICQTYWLGNCDTWEEFFQKHSKENRMPPFHSFDGSSPKQRNVQGCVGIACDGYSLHLYGWKRSANTQRTASRTVREMENDLHNVLDALEQPNCDFYFKDERKTEEEVKRRKHSGRGFVGISSLERAKKLGVVNEQFFENRSALSLDYGVKNVGAGGFFYNSTLCGFLRVTSTDFYRQTGRDKVTSNGTAFWKDLQGELKEHAAFGSRNHWEKLVRSSDADGLISNASSVSKEWLQEYDLYLQQQQQRTAKERSKVWTKEQKFLFEVKQSIDDQYRDIVGKEKIKKSLVIIVGRGGKGGSRGSRGNACTILEKFLAQFYLVLTVDEYNTSKLCPRCHQETEFFNKKQEIRTKKCSHCKTEWNEMFDPKTKEKWKEGKKRELEYWAYDRDFGASVNFYFIARFYAVTGLRPIHFSPEKEKQELLKYLTEEERQEYGKVYGGQESPLLKKR